MALFFRSRFLTIILLCMRLSSTAMELRLISPQDAESGDTSRSSTGREEALLAQEDGLLAQEQEDGSSSWSKEEQPGRGTLEQPGRGAGQKEQEHGRWSNRVEEQPGRGTLEQPGRGAGQKQEPWRNRGEEREDDGDSSFGGDSGPRAGRKQGEREDDGSFGGDLKEVRRRSVGGSEEILKKQGAVTASVEGAGHVDHVVERRTGDRDVEAYKSYYVWGIEM